MKNLAFYIPLIDAESKVNPNDLIQLLKVLDATQPIEIQTKSFNENSSQFIIKVNHIESSVEFPQIVRQKYYSETSNIFLLQLVNNAFILFVEQQFHYIQPPPSEKTCVQISFNYLNKNKRALPKLLDLSVLIFQPNVQLSNSGLISVLQDRVYLFNFKVDKFFQQIIAKSDLAVDIFQTIRGQEYEILETSKFIFTDKKNYEQLINIQCIILSQKIHCLINQIVINGIDIVKNQYKRTITLLQFKPQKIHINISPLGQIVLLIDTQLVIVNMNYNVTQQQQMIHSINIQQLANKFLSSVVALQFQQIQFTQDGQFVIILFQQQIALVHISLIDKYSILFKNENYAGLNSEFLSINQSNFLVKSGQLSIHYFINSKQHIITDINSTDSTLYQITYDYFVLLQQFHLPNQKQGYFKLAIEYFQFLDAFYSNKNFYFLNTQNFDEQDILNIQYPTNEQLIENTFRLILKQLKQCYDQSLASFYQFMIFIDNTLNSAKVSKLLALYLLNQLYKDICVYFNDQHFINILSNYTNIQNINIHQYIDVLKKIVLISSFINRVNTQFNCKKMLFDSFKLQLCIISVILDHSNNRQTAYFEDMFYKTLNNLGYQFNREILHKIQKLPSIYIILLRKNTVFQQSIIFVPKNIDSSNFIASLFKNYSYLVRGDPQNLIAQQFNYQKYDSINFDKIFSDLVLNQLQSQSTIRQFNNFQQAEFVTCSCEISAQQLLYFHRILSFQQEQFILPQYLLELLNKKLSSQLQPYVTLNSTALFIQQDFNLQLTILYQLIFNSNQEFSIGYLNSLITLNQKNSIIKDNLTKLKSSLMQHYDLIKVNKRSNKSIYQHNKTSQQTLNNPLVETMDLNNNTLSIQKSDQISQLPVQTLFSGLSSDFIRIKFSDILQQKSQISQQVSINTQPILKQQVMNIQQQSSCQNSINCKEKDNINYLNRQQDLQQQTIQIPLIQSEQYQQIPNNSSCQTQKYDLQSVQSKEAQQVEQKKSDSSFYEPPKVITIKQQIVRIRQPEQHNQESNINIIGPNVEQIINTQVQKQNAIYIPNIQGQQISQVKEDNIDTIRRNVDRIMQHRDIKQTQDEIKNSKQRDENLIQEEQTQASYEFKSQKCDSLNQFLDRLNNQQQVQNNFEQQQPVYQQKQYQPPTQSQMGLTQINHADPIQQDKNQYLFEQFDQLQAKSAYNQAQLTVLTNNLRNIQQDQQTQKINQRTSFDEEYNNIISKLPFNISNNQGDSFQSFGQALDYIQ